MDTNSTDKGGKRGRPRGSKTKRRRRELAPVTPSSSSQETSPSETPVSDLSKVIEQSKAAIADEAGSAPETSPPTDSPVLGEAPASSPSLPSDFSIAPLIARGLQVPFQAAATKTGFEGFKLSDEEAAREAGNLEHVLTYLMPKVAETDPKLLAILTAAGSLGFTVMGKYMAYQAWLEEKKKNEKKAQGEQKKDAEPSARPPVFGVPAEQYFPRVE